MPTKRAANRAAEGESGHSARRAERRAGLLEAADRAVRRDGPLVSMSAIAAEAGVTKPILYKHFGDKGGLYRAIAESYVRTLMDRLRATLATSGSPRGRITATIEAYLEFVESEPQMYRFLMHRAVGEHPEAQETVARFVRDVAREVTVILRDELRRFGADTGGAEAWAHGIVGMVQLAGDWWLENRTMSRRRLVAYLDDLLWLGFAGLPPAGERPALD